MRARLKWINGSAAAQETRAEIASFTGREERQAGMVTLVRQRARIAAQIVAEKKNAQCSCRRRKARTRRHAFMSDEVVQAMNWKQNTRLHMIDLD